MRAVVQRVSRACVSIGGIPHSEIGDGLLVLVGVEEGDNEEDAAVLARKVVELRVFEDANRKMNRSVKETGGAILAVSQFTLMGDCRKGRRPSFARAAVGERARELYEKFTKSLAGWGISVATGVFQADMDVDLTNRGPVTLLLDTKKSF